MRFTDQPKGAQGGPSLLFHRKADEFEVQRFPNDPLPMDRWTLEARTSTDVALPIGRWTLGVALPMGRWTLGVALPMGRWTLGVIYSTAVALPTVREAFEARSFLYR